MKIIVQGVAGEGKTTVAYEIAKALSAAGLAYTAEIDVIARTAEQQRKSLTGIRSVQKPIAISTHQLRIC